MGAHERAPILGLVTGWAAALAIGICMFALFLGVLLLPYGLIDGVIA